jgi:hypothetical protein
MLRRNHMIVTAALVAVCATPASAASYEDLRSPDAKDAAREAGVVQGPSQDLRSPDTRDAAAASAEGDTYQDLRSPDAKDAAREAGTAPEPVQDLRSPDATDAAAHRGLYEPEGGPYVLDRGYGSPDAVDAARDLPPVQIPAPVVQVRELPSSGFNWGDAGIGAAGMLALFSIAAGSMLLLVGRKRRQGIQVATH